MFFSHPSQSKKFLLLFLMAAIVFSFVLARPVLALVVSDPAVGTATGYLAAKKAADEVKMSFGQALGASVLSGLTYFINKMAYDTATWLATGGKGQSPMWWEKPGEYFQKTGEEAVGEAIGLLGDNVAFLKKYKISLCVPPEPQFQMWLRLAIAESTFPPAPRCNFKQIKQAWSRIDEPGYWRQVGVGFRPGQNDLSVLLGASEAVREVSLITKEKVGKDIEFKGKTKAPEGKVDEAARLAEAHTAEELRSMTAAEQQRKTEAEARITAQELSSGNVGSAFKNAGKLFTNTLAQKFLARFMKYGFLSLADLMKGGGGALTAEGQAVGGREIAEAAFAEFLKPNFANVEQYQYLGELAGDCADNPSPYCGAMDSSLQKALNQGSPLTVACAMGIGAGCEGNEFLNPNWPLKPHCEKNEKEIYCYENLVKLRIFRILPLGWEIAAFFSPEDKPNRLANVVAGFYTPGSPYYHLIDPNWLLKVPIARCNAKVYGPTFLVRDLQRQDYCANVQNCVDEKEGGACPEGLWGYCLREKNIWRLGGDECPEQFNTCAAFTNSGGKTAAYLTNTIDKGLCSADNAGCRAYAVSSVWSNTNNQWQWQVSGNDSKIYFDKQVESCDYASEGCVQLTRTFGGLIGGEDLPDEPLNLKKAPDYYHCYDGIGVNFSSGTLPWWPANKTDMVKLANSLLKQNKEACQKFTPVCSYDEVGCELYTPADHTPAIPGILTENDLCPAECVGYESFKQQKTNFDPPAGGFAYFIPTKAQSCQSDFAGCDEFINLEKQEKGGESKEYYTELRACSQNEAEGAVYYTWEGSDTAGYQLRSYTLKTLKTLNTLNTLKTLTSLNNYTSDEEAPAYNTDNEITLIGYLNICNIDLYKAHTADTDCREFYDKDGNKSYRLYAKTITVSAAECKKLRKSVSDEASCAPTGGIWDDNQKICVYLAIPAEGKSCPANQNNCREYLGNAGHNFQIIYQENFDSGAVGSDAKTGATGTGWDGKFSAESTVVGGKSLKVNQITQSTTTLPQNTTYLLSFWAKGAGQNLQVEFYPSDDAGNSVGAGETQNLPSLQSDWRNYTAGPFTVAWDIATTTVKFSSSGLFFLDNLVVKQKSENVYVISAQGGSASGGKDSWNVPSSCDNVLGDANGGGSSAEPYRLLPQAMLGCQLYKNRQGDKVTVKSFTKMCREEAVGCEEFVNTFNTAAADETFVNVLCELNATSTSNQGVACKDNDGGERCFVPPNQKGCRFNFTGTTPPAALSGGSTKDIENNNYSITIKEDNQTIAIPADRQEYLVNDKKYYCSDDNLGCQALGLISYDASGSPTVGANDYSPPQVYLKNQPDNYSQILCEKAAEGCDEFKTNQGGSAYFKDPEIWGNKICEWKEMLFGAFGSQNTFNGWFKKGTDDPCYEGSAYQIWRAGDKDKYQGKVGECPLQQDTCSEFVDPQNTTPNHPQGVPYYVLNNDKLDRSSCQGQVSQTAGCVLFNETSRGALTWNTTSTYNASVENNYAKVNPIDCGVKGEKCPQSVCLNSDGTVSGTPGTLTDGQGNIIGYSCAKDEHLETANNVNLILKVQRDRVCGQWLACKSSMAVPDVSSPGGFKEVCVELAVCDQAQPSESLLGRCSHWVEDGAAMAPVVKGGIFNKNKYTNRDVSFSGQDFSGYSLYNSQQIVDLKVDNNTQKLTGDIAESCRGYASADAPADYCSFAKVTYSGKDAESISKYYKYNQLLGGEGICSGGFDERGKSKKENTCLTSADCTDDWQAKPDEKDNGVCLLTKQVSRSRGWEGYCLDPTHDIASEAKQSQTAGCVLWYPLSNPSGSVSLDNLFETAGYVPPEGAGQYWCVQAKGNASRSDGEQDTKSYIFEAYHNARNFYPHTANGYNGNRCKYQTPGTCPGTDYPQTQKVGDELITEYKGKPFHFSEILAMELKATGDYYGDGDYYDDTWPVSSLYLFRDQRLAGILNIKDTSTDGRYWSGPLKKKGNNWVLDLVWTTGKKGAVELTYEKLTEVECNLRKQSGDASQMAFRAVFDESGYLEEFRTKICDSGPSESGMQMDMYFYLTEVCVDIRQVIAEKETEPMGFSAKARTDRVWSLSNYTVGGDLVEANGQPKSGIIPLNLPLNQLFSPFGSFNQGADPVTTTLPAYLTYLEKEKGQKSDYEKVQATKKAGYWPIWMTAGGATPLNCVSENGGDCGNIGLCPDGSVNRGLPCSVKKNKDNGNPVCDTPLTGTCSVQKQFICIGENVNDKSIDNYKIPCGSVDACSYANWAPCIPKTGHCDNDVSKSCTINSTCGLGSCVITEKGCQNMMQLLCEQNSDCQLEVHVKCLERGSCEGGNTTQVCVSDIDCQGMNIPYECESANQIRGLCVGGQNHGLACGSSKDCPPKKYTDSAEETVEQGICVGSALDSGTSIPKSEPGRAYERLAELFVQGFGSWEWDQSKGHYKDHLTQTAPYDDSGSIMTKPENSMASIIPKPPQIHSLIASSAAPSGFIWGQADAFSLMVGGEPKETLPDPATGSFTAQLRFFAYADNDQMPLVRMAVDWDDDSSPIYEVRGWFKNRKPWCETEGNKVCQTVTTIDLNRPCQDAYKDCKSGESCSTAGGSDNRLHFGNSSSACQTGYYQFTHIYNCKEGGPGWNQHGASGACRFKPKVQVLDNWGWCNSEDGEGRWNDQKNPDGTLKEEKDKDCYTGKSEPWTSFIGTIEIKP